MRLTISRGRERGERGQEDTLNPLDVSQCLLILKEKKVGEKCFF